MKKYILLTLSLLCLSSCSTKTSLDNFLSSLYEMYPENYKGNDAYLYICNSKFSNKTTNEIYLLNVETKVYKEESLEGLDFECLENPTMLMFECSVIHYQDNNYSGKQIINFKFKDETNYLKNVKYDNLGEIISSEEKTFNLNNDCLFWMYFKFYTPFFAHGYINNGSTFLLINYYENLNITYEDTNVLKMHYDTTWNKIRYNYLNDNLKTFETLEKETGVNYYKFDEELKITNIKSIRNREMCLFNNLTNSYDNKWENVSYHELTAIESFEVTI